MLKKVFLGLVLAAFVVITGTAQAQQDAPFVVNGMQPRTIGVFENPGGLGDTLLFGYYNVRGFNNFIALINTDTSNGVTGRIRFREAKKSQEVLDFNICLSAGDAWFAIIFDDGTEGFVQPFGTDTLTRPAIGDGFPFRHADNGGLPGVTAEDTKEGYVEFIGLVRTAADPATCEATTVSLGPTNDVLNSLAGGLYLIDPLDGEAYGYRATALANFQQVGIPTPGISQEDVTMNDALGGVTAVNFALTRSHLYGAYVVDNDPDILGEAAVVVTFPTKSISEGLSVPGIGVIPLFDRDLDTGCAAGFNNVRIGITAWDDAEHRITTEEAPSPVREQIEDFCFEVNVREFDNDFGTSTILDSQVSDVVPLGSFKFGYFDLDLTQEDNHQTTNPFNGDVTRGVPAIGYQLHKFVNGAGSMSVPVWYKTTVVPVGN